MSRAKRSSDAERTAVMVDLIHRSYRSRSGEPRDALPPRYVLVEEVAPGTGWISGQRYADLLAVSMWPSDGLRLHGYEIKASKSDLRRELADMSKHRAVARYCDTWTLVAWDETVLVPGIPDHWGIAVTAEDEQGRTLKTMRPAARLEPDPWPREFACSLVRNAYQQSPGAAYVARACGVANTEGRNQGKEIANADWLHALRPVFELVFGKDEWRWSSDPAKIVAAIAVKLGWPV